MTSHCAREYYSTFSKFIFLLIYVLQNPYLQHSHYFLMTMFTIRASVIKLKHEVNPLLFKQQTTLSTLFKILYNMYCNVFV